MLKSFHIKKGTFVVTFIIKQFQYVLTIRKKLKGKLYFLQKLNMLIAISFLL